MVVCMVFMYGVLVSAVAALVWFGIVVFFFKQKTAYEMLRSLVGSEMCIRDSYFSAL